MKIIIITVIISVSQFAYGIRAGLDFTYIASDGEKTEKITCDLCSHYYNTDVQLFVMSVNSNEGYVNVIFLTDDDAQSENWEAQHPIEETRDYFDVNAYQKTKVKEGQTVRLKGTNYSFKLLSALGKGCPISSQC